MSKHLLIERAEQYEEYAQESDAMAETADSEPLRQFCVRVAAEWRARVEELREKAETERP